MTNPEPAAAVKPFGYRESTAEDSTFYVHCQRRRERDGADTTPGMAPSSAAWDDPVTLDAVLFAGPAFGSLATARWPVDVFGRPKPMLDMATLTAVCAHESTMRDMLAVRNYLATHEPAALTETELAEREPRLHAFIDWFDAAIDLYGVLVRLHAVQGSPGVPTVDLLKNDAHRFDDAVLEVRTWIADLHAHVVHLLLSHYGPEDIEAALRTVAGGGAQEDAA